MSFVHLSKKAAMLALFAMSALFTMGQSEVDHSYKPLTLKLDESGAKYIRFLTWHQVWVQTNNLSVNGAKTQLTPMMRRSRFLFYAQISPRFLILTHIGLNNLTPANLSPLGNDSDPPQYFLHDAWTEFKVTRNDAIYIGGGLHYWKGLTRLASASTLNFMTLDQARPFAHWHSLGITDMFARHLGVYAKGAIGKLDYRLAWNAPSRTSLGAGKTYGADTTYLYTGVLRKDEEGNPMGNTVVEGYVRYNFFDKESIKLPFNVGTYMGEKKIFALGAGFFAHPDGTYNQLTGEHKDVLHLAADVFLDYPVEGGNAIHAYASYMNFNYGENFVSRWAGTGSVLYGQFGFYVKSLKLMPYLAYQYAGYEGFPDPVTGFDAGVNYFLNGHHAKLTLEYHQISNDRREVATTGELSQLRLQAHFFL